MDLEDALFAEDKMCRVVGTLSVFITVWVQWMDSELSANNPRRSIGLKQVQEQVWTKGPSGGRAKFEELYDGLGDEDMDELGQKSNLLRELFAESKQYTEQKRMERNLAKLDIRPFVLRNWGRSTVGLAEETEDGQMEVMNGGDIGSSREGGF